MKVLILGDPNKFFRIEYVKNMKKFYPHYEFHIASNYKLNLENSPYDKVIFINYNRKKNIIRELYKVNSQIKDMEQYDYVHIHSANLFWLPFIKTLKKKCKKIILTYYGSDFYRANKYRKFLFRFYNSSVNTISFTSKRMKNDVLSYVKNDKKCRVVPFGNSILDYIDRSLDEGKENLRERMGIPKDNLVITVGYNATIQQRHIRILGIIERALCKDIDVTILLPLNYGDKEYQVKLHSDLEKINLNIKTYDDFLTGENIADLRAVSDIMIHMQDSDQFSASVVEYLYADNILLNGSWIDYKELKEWGIYYKEIDSFENLSQILIETIKNYSIEKRKINSKEILKRKLGWNSVCELWNALYD